MAEDHVLTVDNVVTLSSLLNSLLYNDTARSLKISFEEDHALTDEEVTTLFQEVGSTCAGLEKLLLLFHDGASVPFDLIGNALKDATQITKMDIECMGLSSSTTNEENNNNADDIGCFQTYLEKYSSIKEFKLSYTSISPGSTILDTIVASLSRTTTLEKIWIYVKPYLTGSCTGLKKSYKSLELLCNLPNLTMLKLVGIQMSEKNIQHMCRALESNTTLKELGMCGCSLSNSCAMRLATMLRYNITLERLDLSWNQVCDIGCVEFAKALEVNQTLQRLYLHQNKGIGKGSYEPLKQMFERNFVMKDLWTSVGDKKLMEMVFFYSNLNKNGTRDILRNANAKSDDLVTTISSCNNQLPLLFYHISMRPDLIADVCENMLSSEDVYTATAETNHTAESLENKKRTVLARSA